MIPMKLKVKNNHIALGEIILTLMWLWPILRGIQATNKGDWLVRTLAFINTTFWITLLSDTARLFTKISNSSTNNSQISKSRYTWITYYLALYYLMSWTQHYGTSYINEIHQPTKAHFLHREMSGNKIS